VINALKTLYTNSLNEPYKLTFLESDINHHVRCSPIVTNELSRQMSIVNSLLPSIHEEFLIKHDSKTTKDGVDEHIKLDLYGANESKTTRKDNLMRLEMITEKENESYSNSNLNLNSSSPSLPLSGQSSSNSSPRTKSTVSTDESTLNLSENFPFENISTNRKAPIACCDSIDTEDFPSMYDDPIEMKTNNVIDTNTDKSQQIEIKKLSSSKIQTVNDSQAIVQNTTINIKTTTTTTTTNTEVDI
jgi:hypothetical protein